ncbi:MAG TPA: hypothetical protein PK337_11450 [Bacteroidia bacterium]|nr:hypothetical protein [Bacteroidia bacterium]
MKSTSKILAAILLALSFIQSSCKKKDDDDPQPITLDCADITANRVLTDIVPTAGAVDYIVPCDIGIDADLTISQGVVIQFAANTGFIINNTGSLNAIGTADLPIVFRGASDVAGFWKGLFFNSNNVLNQLSHVTITGAGSNSFNGNDVVANIRVYQTAQLGISNCSINKSGRDGIYTDGTASNDLNPITSFGANSFNNNTAYPLNISAPVSGMMDEASLFSGNGNNKILIRGGEINTAVKWRKTQVPFLVSGDVIISPYVGTGSVYIESGSTIQFAAESSLGVGEYSTGSLKIIGTATQRITLTGEVESPGSWQGIGFQSTNVLNEIAFTDISYGGCCSFSGSSGDVGNVVVGAFSAGFVKISNTSVNFSQQCGIKVKSPASSINNAGGITYNGNAAGTLCN